MTDAHALPLRLPTQQKINDGDGDSDGLLFAENEADGDGDAPPVADGESDRAAEADVPPVPDTQAEALGEKEPDVVGLDDWLEAGVCDGVELAHGEGCAH